MCIRTVLAEYVGKARKDISNEIEALEAELKEMHKLKEKACDELNCNKEISLNIKCITLVCNVISRIMNDILVLREKQSSDTAFRAKAKWFDLGEKYNKYFLNLKLSLCIGQNS